MQTNDLNKLLATKYDGLGLGDFIDNDSSEDIYVSEFSPLGKFPSKEQLKENKKPISKEILNQVRSDVTKYEQLGKSRRWIRRYIKRKFNIVEY